MSSIEGLLQHIQHQSVESTANEMRKRVAHVIDMAVQLPNTVIAGGYPRNVAFGLKPNDIDIFCYGGYRREASAFIRSVLHSQGYRLVNEYDNSGYIQTERQIECVYEYAAAGLPDVDVVVQYTGSEEGVIERFDHNINQWVLHACGPKFLGYDYGTLKRIRDLDTTDERIEKMQALAKQVGWEVPV